MSTPFNIFGVPRTFPTPNPVSDKTLWQSDKALMPWRIYGHDELYAAIDGFVEAATRFEKSFPQSDDLLADGHLIVVSGNRGSGRTSFIHWCVNHLVSLVDPPDPTSAKPGTVRPEPKGCFVLDLGGPENFVPYLLETSKTARSFTEINEDIYRRIWAKLPKNGDFLAAAELYPDVKPIHMDESYNQPKDADERLQRVHRCYEALSEVLIYLRRLAVIIVPRTDRSEWRGLDMFSRHVRTCHQHSRPGIITFVETSQVDPRQELARCFLPARVPRNVLHLSLGELRPDDHTVFIQTRQQAFHPHPVLVTIPAAELCQYRPTPGYENVLELQQTLFDAATIAARRQKASLVISDLRALDRQREQEMAGRQSLQALLREQDEGG